MNYIGQIRYFWRSHEEHSFSSTEIALYFYLLEICNICQWKNRFKRNNALVAADLSISYNTLKNARNRLTQCGLIEFCSKNGSPNVEYTLSKFDEVTNEVASEVGVEVGTRLLARLVSTKDKLNKTKLNKKDIGGKLLSPPPEKSKKSLEKFTKPTLREVTAYCQERKNSVSPQKFLDYYDSNGWMVGKSKMKDWRAAVRTWEQNQFENGSKNSSTGISSSTNPAKYGADKWDEAAAQAGLRR